VIVVAGYAFHDQGMGHPVGDPVRLYLTTHQLTKRGINGFTEHFAIFGIIELEYACSSGLDFPNAELAWFDGVQL
jgi:hypothetical protein